MLRGFICVMFALQTSSLLASERTQPVYRFWSGANHFQTLSYAEGANAGFHYEGIGFYVMTRDDYGARVALYRCLVPGTMDHFVSVDGRCENQIYEGVYGYAFPESRKGTAGLYRCYGEQGDHLATLSPEECSQAGYRIEGLLGFVPTR